MIRVVWQVCARFFFEGRIIRPVRYVSHNFIVLLLETNRALPYWRQTPVKRRFDLFHSLKHLSELLLPFEFLFLSFVAYAWLIGVETASYADILMFNPFDFLFASQYVQ